MCSPTRGRQSYACQFMCLSTDYLDFSVILFFPRNISGKHLSLHYLLFMLKRLLHPWNVGFTFILSTQNTGKHFIHSVLVPLLYFTTSGKIRSFWCVILKCSLAAQWWSKERITACLSNSSFMKMKTLIFEATGYILSSELWFFPTETFWD